MQDWWNNQYAMEYSTSYYNCLDESMNRWLNQYCPGWMCASCKQHHFGNEYHTIVDKNDGIAMVWQVELWEGKDRPQQLGKKLDEMGATVELILCMTEPIYQTGKIVTYDSGFFVPKGVIELHKHGVYDQALIKKRGWYWPHSVHGDLFDGYFGDKDMGTRMT